MLVTLGGIMMLARLLQSLKVPFDDCYSRGDNDPFKPKTCVKGTCSKAGKAIGQH